MSGSAVVDGRLADDAHESEPVVADCHGVHADAVQIGSVNVNVTNFSGVVVGATMNGIAGCGVDLARGRNDARSAPPFARVA